MALLCMGFVSAPAIAAGPQLDKAVSLAAPGSQASLNDITLSVFKAVKEAPEEAVSIFRKVVSQRKDWTADELYGILRAVLLARPDLEGNLHVLAKVPRDDVRVKAEQVSPSPDNLVQSEILDLLVALVESPVSEQTIQAVVYRLNLDAFSLREINIRIARGHVGGGAVGLNTNMNPRQSAEYVIPSPEPVSPEK